MLWFKIGLVVAVGVCVVLAVEMMEYYCEGDSDE